MKFHILWGVVNSGATSLDQVIYDMKLDLYHSANCMETLSREKNIVRGSLKQMTSLHTETWLCFHLYGH